MDPKCTEKDLLYTDADGQGRLIQGDVSTDGRLYYDAETLEVLDSFPVHDDHVRRVGLPFKRVRGVSGQ
jgi:hypothetical protein